MKKWFSLLIPVFVIYAALQPFACASGTADSSGALETIAADSSDQSHYVFQPKICSVFMKEVFGEAMCETLGHPNHLTCRNCHYYRQSSHRKR